MEYAVWGGYNYAVGIETFDSLIEAATEYLHRMSSLATRFPLWGDCADDDYVLTTEHEGWTLQDLRVVANSTFGYYS
jgi:hypothetical protein